MPKYDGQDDVSNFHGRRASTSSSPAGIASSIQSASAERMWQLDDFELGPCIGVGSFGRIVAARERHSKAVVVLKAMKKRRVERLKVQRHVVHEIEIQAHLRHPNVLKLYGFFWDASHIFLILEHAIKGDLSHLLKLQKHQRFSERSAAPLVAQVMSGVEYCHRMHVIHRDLKPQNIFVGRNRQVKLADFGWAVHSYPDQQRWTLCGTLDYLPPEIVHAVRGHSFAVDVWGLGVLTYEMLEGVPPFSAPTCEETYRRILKSSPAFTPKENDSNTNDEQDVEEPRLSRGAIGLITALLKKEPSERLPLNEALAHLWLREFAQDGSSCCGCSPAAHAGA
jgi:serine/threonine protein kinase